MKILGREPAFLVGVIEAVIALAVAFGLDLTTEQTALVMAVVVSVFGVYTAYVTHDTLLGVGVGLAKAVLALAIGFGLKLSPDQIGTLLAFITVVAGFSHRTQTAPADTPSFQLAA